MPMNGFPARLLSRINIQLFKSSLTNYYSLFDIYELYYHLFAWQNNNRFAHHIIGLTMATYNCGSIQCLFYEHRQFNMAMEEFIRALVMPLNSRTFIISTAHSTRFHCVPPMSLPSEQVVTSRCTKQSNIVVDVLQRSNFRFVSAISSRAILSNLLNVTSMRLCVLISIRGHIEHSNVLFVDKDTQIPTRWLPVGLAYPASTQLHTYMCHSVLVEINSFQNVTSKL